MTWETFKYGNQLTLVTFVKKILFFGRLNFVICERSQNLCSDSVSSNLKIEISWALNSQLLTASMSTTTNDFYMGNIQVWKSGVDTCDICKKGPFLWTSEFCYYVKGDKTYVQTACIACTKEFMKKDCDYSNPEVWQKSIKDGKNTYNQFRSIMLIDNDMHEKVMTDEIKKIDAYGSFFEA